MISSKKNTRSTAEFHNLCLDIIHIKQKSKISLTSQVD